jgi:hypothetical protein
MQPEIVQQKWVYCEAPAYNAVRALPPRRSRARFHQGLRKTGLIRFGGVVHRTPAPSLDVILDILIVVVVAAAVFIGYKRGTIQPIFSLLGFGLTVLILTGHWSSYSRFLNQHHSNTVVDGLLVVLIALLVGYAGWRLGGFVHRMPVIRGADGLLGVVICGLVAIWLLYGMLSMGVSLGKGFDGTIGQSSTSEAQAQAIGIYIEGNPILRRTISTSEVQQLEEAARTPNNPNSAISNFTSLSQLQAVYRVFVLKQLQTSHLAPTVMWVGKHTPVIGHEGPSDLPAKPTPAPVVSPSASPSP